MKNRITDIHCPQCGAPANFDIVQQMYVCGHCGGTVGITEAQKEKQGFRSMRRERLRDSVKKYKLFRTSCSGCGAEVVFEENEALAGCPFCGRNLVRSEYLKLEKMPESIVPFGITQQEAQERLRAWCKKNRGRKEAKQLLPLLPELKGFYLPYSLLRGPVHMKAGRIDTDVIYRCEGFMEDALINCSAQLDNLLLDGMEPFDMDGLTEFDFGYVAGQRVKISDINEKELNKRACQEVEECYTPAVRKTMETKAVRIEASISSAVELPVLVPVYYICRGDLMAAVNGQTGKVSVRALNESHYYFLPWWLKALISTLVLGFFYLIVVFCVYSDTTKNSFAVEAGREIFTSGKETFHRERGKLLRNESILKRKIVPPVFFCPIDGKDRPVTMKFTTPARVLRMFLLAFIALFLPVIVAFPLTGFDVSKLNLAGSAVWFCIAVPVVPAAEIRDRRTARTSLDLHRFRKRKKETLSKKARSKGHRLLDSYRTEISVRAARLPGGVVRNLQLHCHGISDGRRRVTLYSIHWTKGVPGGTSCPVTVSITRTQLSRSVQST